MKIGSWKEETQICFSGVKGDRNSKVIDCGCNQSNGHTTSMLASHSTCFWWMPWDDGKLGLTLLGSVKGTTLKSVGNEALIILLPTK